MLYGLGWLPSQVRSTAVPIPARSQAFVEAFAAEFESHTSTFPVCLNPSGKKRFLAWTFDSFPLRVVGIRSSSRSSLSRVGCLHIGSDGSTERRSRRLARVNGRVLPRPSRNDGRTITATRSSQSPSLTPSAMTSATSGSCKICSSISYAIIFQPEKRITGVKESLSAGNNGCLFRGPRSYNKRGRLHIQS